MVVHYGKLNKITIPRHFTIPNFDDFLEKFHKARIFITGDLFMGHLQMPISERAKPLTAFITETQTGQFETAMLGLSWAPIYSAKLMEMVLGKAQKKGIALNFFDDIFVYAENWEELMNNFEMVLQLLLDARLTLNIEKRRFGMRRVEFLGYILGESELQPGDRKIAAVEQFPCPSDKHAIRRFLGLAGFFRRFVPDFARKAQPLSNLLKRDIPFEWTPATENAFQEIKSVLVKKPILKLYNPNTARTELHTDASAAGLGAMLL